MAMSVPMGEGKPCGAMYGSCTRCLVLWTERALCLAFPPTLRLDAPTLSSAKIHNTLYYNYTHKIALCQVFGGSKTPKAQEVRIPVPLVALTLLSFANHYVFSYQPGPICEDPPSAVSCQLNLCASCQESCAGRFSAGRMCGTRTRSQGPINPSFT